MPKESSSDKLRIDPSDEIAALLMNCRDLVMHQMIGDARDLLRATKRIAREFSISSDDVFSTLDDAVISKPYYVAMATIDKAITGIKNSALEKKRGKKSSGGKPH